MLFFLCVCVCLAGRLVVLAAGRLKGRVGVTGVGRGWSELGGGEGNIYIYILYV